MRGIANRTLLVASYLVMSTNMAIEVIAHPEAKDHTGSILGLGFCLLILVALVRRFSPALAQIAAVLNALIAMGGAYLIGYYVYSRGVSLAAAPDILVRTYFVVVVPIFAIRYFVAATRASRPPATSLTEPRKLQIPVWILFLDIVGLIPLTIGAPTLEGSDLLPEQYRFNGYGIVCMLVGVLLMTPMGLWIYRLRRKTPIRHDA